MIPNKCLYCHGEAVINGQCKYHYTEGVPTPPEHIRNGDTDRETDFMRRWYLPVEDDSEDDE